MSRIIIIGAGFSSLSAAAYLAKAGHEVHVLEKWEQPGGRARTYKAEGFLFDMGPSWYWMPDVFERFFSNFGKKVSDYYNLVRLNPSYKVVWQDGSQWDIPAGMEALSKLLEEKEKGAGKQLEKFLAQAKKKYEIGIQELVYKPNLSFSEYLHLGLLKGLLESDVFTSMRKHIAKYFSDSKIKELLEFPVLFLGAGAQDIPALYSLMNYADIVGGTWYPMGGMHLIAKAMEAVAKEQGVHFHYREEVLAIETEGTEIKGIKTANQVWTADFYLSGADYHHTENLLPKSLQQYDEKYWQKRTMAPSALIYYVGLNTKMPDTVTHHTLFFDADFERHSEEIYDRPQMPSDPLFYLCAPSKTDSSVAPEGCENLFFLIPTAPGLENDTEDVRQEYFELLCTRLEKHYGMDIRPHIIHQRSFSVKDFKQDYNSFKGNAYGLANTLNQTAILKPRLVSKKVRNLAYCGQLTVPGPGVPPALVSGEVAANYIHQQLKRTKI